MCVCILCGCVEDNKALELRVVCPRHLCVRSPRYTCIPSELRSLTHGPPIAGFESGVCSVIYCYPTSYRGRSTLGTHFYFLRDRVLYSQAYTCIYINLGT